MESFLVARGPEQAKDLCNEIDKRMRNTAPDAAMQCFHGIGHGAVAQANRTDNFRGKDDAMAKAALRICERISSDRPQLIRCGSGVFNTIALFYGRNEYGLVLEKTDPLRLCRAQEKRHKHACYISMNVALMGMTRGNFLQSAKFLEQISEDENAEATQAILNLASVSGSLSITKGSYTEDIALCRSLQERLRLPCIQGFAFGMLESGPPESEYVRPFQFCALDSLSEKEQTACFTYLSAYLTQWYPREKNERICATAPERHRALCFTYIRRGFNHE